MSYLCDLRQDISFSLFYSRDSIASCAQPCNSSCHHAFCSLPVRPTSFEIITVVFCSSVPPHGGSGRASMRTIQLGASMSGLKYSLSELSRHLPSVECIFVAMVANFDRYEYMREAVVGKKIFSAASNCSVLISVSDSTRVTDAIAAVSLTTRGTEVLVPRRQRRAVLTPCCITLPIVVHTRVVLSYM